MDERPDLADPGDPTEEARRNSRFTYAERRIRKLVDGAPALSAEQRERLALLLHPGSGVQDAS